MGEKLTAALAFCAASALIALARPDQGIYPYADHPISYGFFLCGILCVTGALFYLAVDRLSRPPEKRHGAKRARAQGEGALPAAEPLGWREKLAPALLFFLGSVLGAFEVPLAHNGGLGVSLAIAFAGVMLFALGVHLWLASINRKLGVEPGSRFLPERGAGISTRFDKFACGLVLFTAANLFGSSLDRHEVLELWPFAFVPPFVPLLLYLVSDRLQHSIDERFENFDARAIAPAGIGESQTQPT